MPFLASSESTPYTLPECHRQSPFVAHLKDLIVSDIAPAVSIIVPCRNEKDQIEACVLSILRQVPPDGGLEVIVADGLSNDGTRDILRRLADDNSRLQILDNSKLTIPTGLNLAIRKATGRIIIRMDAHAEYAADYVCQCLAVLQETQADNVGGPVRTKSGGYIQSAIGAAYHSPFAAGPVYCHNIKYEGYVDTVPWGCWRREVFDRFGLFDEQFIRNEDDEFNLRLTRAGGKLWQSPRIKGWYTPRASLLALFRQYKQYGYWKVRVILKHKFPASIRHLVPGIFVFLLGGLPLLAIACPGAAWVWQGLIGIYSVCTIFASFWTAARDGWKFFPLLPIVFACYHCGYGYGFLRGLYDFVILRRAPSRHFIELTRPSSRLPNNRARAN
jgi:glycosyltransferase involved in cell wall biosynthesis